VIPASARPLVDELLARCHFPAPGTGLACAVSGGPDSSALAVLATSARCVVTLHHVDHGIRPGSYTEARLVESLAERLGAGFCAHRVVVEPGPNLEARARAARSAVLPASIATGHTLDDRAETVMINLLRGAARTGMSPMRDRARHPIVGLRRCETVRLCRALDLDVVIDPSNDDPSFVRNRVRHELLPLMNDIARRDCAALLDRQADILADEDALLDALAGAIDPTDAKAVTAAQPALARRAIRNFITDSWLREHPPGIDAVERVLAVASGSASSCEIEGGHRVYRTAQKLRLEPPSLI
jgi:tRNA(Ile)-lysidine synthase